MLSLTQRGAEGFDLLGGHAADGRGRCCLQFIMRPHGAQVRNELEFRPKLLR